MEGDAAKNKVKQEEFKTVQVRPPELPQASECALMETSRRRCNSLNAPIALAKSVVAARWGPLAPSEQHK